MLPYALLVGRELLARGIAELARVRVYVDALDLGEPSGAEVEQRRRNGVTPNLEVAREEAGERRRLRPELEGWLELIGLARLAVHAHRADDGEPDSGRRRDGDDEWQVF